MYKQQGYDVFTFWHNNSQYYGHADCILDRSLCYTERHCVVTTSPPDFFCTSSLTPGLSAWLLIHVLPTFLPNLVMLGTTLRTYTLRTLAVFPELAFSGAFSPFIFEPIGMKKWWKGWRLMSLSSGRVIYLNLALGALQATAEAYLLTQNYSESFWTERTHSTQTALL